MTDLPFPQALKELLESSDMSNETLKLLSDGWDNLSLGERKSLAQQIAVESDSLRRVAIALNGIIPAVANLASQAVVADVSQGMRRGV